MSEQEVKSLLAKTAPKAREGAFELFKTTSIYDGTASHPEWLGEEPQRLREAVLMA
jgi:hypothetical protein